MPSPALLDDLAADVVRLGRQAGLDAAGICDASPFHEALAALNAGRQQGWDAGMQFTYRNPARSTDPQRALPGAKSMVVGARRYDRNATADRDDARPKGFVGRYAREDHYRHLRNALGQVADHLRDQGWQAVVLVDDNALVDRAAAVRAGLGWYGKNTNVLIPGAGSWFVLGTVVTDAPLLGRTIESGSGFVRNSARIDAQKPIPRPNTVDLEIESPAAATLTPGPVADGCGTCRRCVDACPTGALTHDEPGHLDAGKCLAWLVQAPGIFPREYRVALHDRIYGCDDCQEACPVNRLASRKEPPPPADPQAQVTMDVLGILSASNEELLEKFGRWYIAERDPAHLRRNALIVVGNVGDPDDPEVRAAIDHATSHTEPMIRAHAVWAAARLGYHDLIPTGDSNPQVQQEIEAAPRVTTRTIPA